MTDTNAKTGCDCDPDPATEVHAEWCSHRYESAHAALAGRLRAVQEETAELHDIISSYDAITDPEQYPDLHERAFRALDEDKDHTGCTALEKLTARAEAAEAQLAALQQERAHGATTGVDHDSIEFAGDAARVDAPADRGGDRGDRASAHRADAHAVEVADARLRAVEAQQVCPHCGLTLTEGVAHRAWKDGESRSNV